MNFFKKLFNDDAFFATFFFICLLSLLVCTITLININQQIKTQRLNPESYDNLNEVECLSAQVKCYRENTGLDENESVSKCREINYCFAH
jgi:hypothetical protein